MTVLAERHGISALLDDLTPGSGLAVRRWTPDEYERMASAGLFGPDERLELANGEIVERGPGLPRLLGRAEYYNLAELGIFGPEERTELIYGRVITRMSPMSRPHSVSVIRTADALEAVFGTALAVEQQMPLRLAEGQEPEPDVMLLLGTSLDYTDAPEASDVLLLVEVSLATLRYDRGTKARMYAAAGVPDYWLINLRARTLEVRRQPEDGEYLSLDVYNETEAVAPLSAPDVPVRVADLLPLVQF